MAKRRMFSLDVIDTDMFLDMSVGSQNLYFHLAMRADDDGFVSSPKKIIKITNATQNDYDILIAKKFVIPFENGVCVIKHWKLHNLIQKDRYKKTIYSEEMASISQDNNGVYNMYPECIQDVSKMEPQVRLGKVRLGKGSQEKVINTCENKFSQEIPEIIQLFKDSLSPSLSFGNKTQRKACEEMIEKFGFDQTMQMAEKAISVQGLSYAPVVTTPHQLYQKLGQLKIYFQSEKSKSQDFINLNDY